MNILVKSDEDMASGKDNKALGGLGAPMTRGRARKAKEALQQVVATILEAAPNLEDLKSKMVHCIIPFEGP